MRIGISGAHNTGKSTIARSLIKEFGFQDETDFVRRYYTSKYGMPQENLDSQYLVINTWVDAVFRKESFIIDRTPIDHLIYANTLGYGTLALTNYSLIHLSYLDIIILTRVHTWVVQSEKERRYNQNIQERYQDSLNIFVDQYLDVKEWPEKIPLRVDFDLKPWTHGNNSVRIFLLPEADIDVMKDMSKDIIRSLSGSEIR